MEFINDDGKIVGELCIMDDGNLHPDSWIKIVEPRKKEYTYNVLERFYSMNTTVDNFRSFVFQFLQIHKLKKIFIESFGVNNILSDYIKIELREEKYKLCNCGWPNDIVEMVDYKGLGRLTTSFKPLNGFEVGEQALFIKFNKYIGASSIVLIKIVGIK